MSDEVVTGESLVEPICPNCREPLTGAVRQQEIPLRESPDGPGGPPLNLVFCGHCGWTLQVVLAPRRMPGGMGPFGGGRGRMGYDVASPENEESLEGQFQLRCKVLIGEIRGLGFNPNVWVAMINELGGLGAAKKLLADHHVLVATPWLVERKRSELTLEHEIEQTKWADLFTNDERALARSRLAAAGGAA